jgi:hypothetical protein
VGGEPKLDEALALFDEGRAATARGDHALGVEKLQASVALSPTAPSLAALGQSLKRVGRSTEAVIHLAAAIGLGDTSPAVRTALAIALAGVGEHDEALKRLRELMHERPDDDGVRAELKRLLRDPIRLARLANRHRLLDEIRAALPEIRLKDDDSPILGLKLVGRYVATWATPPRDLDRLEPAFRFLNRLAVSPDQEMSDLLTAVVFPMLTSWRSAVGTANELLVGRGRRVLEDAVALWGPPIAEDPPLGRDDLPELLRLLLPDFEAPEVDLMKLGPALGRYYVSAIKAGAPDGDLRRAGLLLSRMAASDDAAVRWAFDDALKKILEIRSPAAIEVAKRDFTGLAQTALTIQLD